MLKLKYLFDNRDLAMMLLENWDYDETSIELFKYFRISSNAIYPFRNKEKLMFLRFVPVTEKTETELYAELEIIEKLKENQFNVSNIIESKNGETVVKKSTPWGEYFAVVWEGVGINSLENTELSEELCYEYGKLLSQFHNISREKIKNDIDKISVYDLLEKIIREKIGNEVLYREITKIKNSFESLPKDSQNFGIIHYDFELDNIMFDEKSGKLYAIDFDDSMYGFYGQDIERAINSIENEVEEELKTSFVKSFLEGYEALGNNITDYTKNREIYKVFANLYSYYRIENSLEEAWGNEPSWMKNLRSNLGRRQENYIKSLI